MRQLLTILLLLGMMMGIPATVFAQTDTTGDIPNTSVLPVHKVVISGPTSVAVGSYIQLKAVTTAVTSNGASVTVAETYLWRSGDATVANVMNGYVKGLAVGEITVVAKGYKSGAEGAYTVKVVASDRPTTDPLPTPRPEPTPIPTPKPEPTPAVPSDGTPVHKILITGSNTLTVGGYIQLKAATNVITASGNTAGLLEGYTWKSSDETIAVVSNGAVKGLAVGEVIISAKGVRSLAVGEFVIKVAERPATEPDSTPKPEPRPEPLPQPKPEPQPLPVPVPAQMDLNCFPLLRANADYNSFLAVFNPIAVPAKIKLAALAFNGDLLGEAEIQLKGMEWKLIAFDNDFFNKSLPVENGSFYVLAGAKDIVVMQAVMESVKAENGFFEVMNPAPVNMIMGSAYYKDDENYETSLLLVNVHKAKDVIVKIGLNSLAEGVEDNVDESDNDSNPASELSDGNTDKPKDETDKPKHEDQDDTTDEDGTTYEPLPSVQPKGDVKGVVQLKPREAKIVKLSEVVDVTVNKSGAVVLRSDRLVKLNNGNKGRMFAAVIIYTAKKNGTISVGQLFGPNLPLGLLPKYFDPKGKPAWAPKPVPPTTDLPKPEPTPAPTPKPEENILPVPPTTTLPPVNTTSNTPALD